MFERLTESARNVMALANQEAEKLDREHVATEHILFGLMKEGTDAGAQVLKKFNVDLHKVQLEVERYDKATPEAPIAHEHYVPKIQTITEYAVEEARHLGNNYVGTEHIVLALLREENGNAAAILTGMGIKLEDLRRETLDAIAHGAISEEE